MIWILPLWRLPMSNYVVNGAGYIYYLQFEGFLVGTLCPTQLCVLVAYKHHAKRTEKDTYF